ncbi:MAG: hypothetical protein EOO22_28230, partial [Comamonadaceae bacterium]
MEVVAKLPATEQRDGDLRQVLAALSAFRRGEPGVTLPTEWDGVLGKIATEFNELSGQTSRTTQRIKAAAGATQNGSTHASRRVDDDKLTGFWQDSVGHVNSMLEEVELSAARTRTLLTSLTELKKGNAAAELPHDWTGLFGKVADAFNDVVAENVRISQELSRLSRVVG